MRGGGGSGEEERREGKRGEEGGRGEERVEEGRGVAVMDELEWRGGGCACGGVDV